MSARAAQHLSIPEVEEILMSTECFLNDIPEVEAKLVEDARAEGRPLGRGSYGSCYLFHDGGGVPLCVKVLHTAFRTPRRLWKALFEEASRMVRVKDIPGMVRLVGVSLWPAPAIVTRYAGEALSALLRKGRLSGDDARGVVAQIVRTTSELTKASLCHADLKANNIVVDVDTLRVTIVDLGMMEEFGYNPGWKGRRGRSLYAPELYKGEAYSPATQVYQVGEVLSEICLQVENFIDFTLVNMAIEASDAAPASRPEIESILKYTETYSCHELSKFNKRKRDEETTEVPLPKRVKEDQ